MSADPDRYFAKMQKKSPLSPCKPITLTQTTQIWIDVHSSDFFVTLIFCRFLRGAGLRNIWKICEKSIPNFKGPKYVSRFPESIRIVDFFSIFSIFLKFHRNTTFLKYTAWTKRDREMVQAAFDVYFETQQHRSVHPTSYLQDFADRKWTTSRFQEYTASTERDRGMVPTAFYSYSKVQQRCLRHRISSSNRSRDTTLQTRHFRNGSR